MGTPVAPPARSFAAAAPDGHGAVILFGGDPSDPAGSHADTWRWDGARWSELHPAPVPDGGAFRTMAQGPDGAPVLVVSLADGDVRTWRWSAAADDWRLEQPATSPPWRDEAGLVLDQPSHRLLLAGGVSRQGVRSGDTWAWDGTSWSELHPAHRPAGGPASAAGPLLYEQDGTWTWTGADWTRVQRAGEPPWRPYMALAATSDGARAVLLTGTVGEPGQTWLWNGAHWARS